LPHVPKDAEVIIAGKNPPAELSSRIEKLNKQDSYALVTLTPNPKDIMTIVCGCDIFVCPTRLGGGLKLRVMDGLKAGLPVIAHQVSARGYSVFKTEGILWSFENGEDFGACIHEVIKKLADGRLPKCAIQEYAALQFSFETKTSMLKDFLTK
jgi:glycosyltransferase involved in cell wall biosynthesis